MRLWLTFLIVFLIFEGRVEYTWQCSGITPSDGQDQMWDQVGLTVRKAHALPPVHSPFLESKIEAISTVLGGWGYAYRAGLIWYSGATCPHLPCPWKIQEKSYMPGRCHPNADPAPISQDAFPASGRLQGGLAQLTCTPVLPEAVGVLWGSGPRWPL